MVLDQSVLDFTVDNFYRQLACTAKPSRHCFKRLPCRFRLLQFLKLSMRAKRSSWFAVNLDFGPTTSVGPPICLQSKTIKTNDFDQVRQCNFTAMQYRKEVRKLIRLLLSIECKFNIPNFLQFNYWLQLAPEFWVSVNWV